MSNAKLKADLERSNTSRSRAELEQKQKQERLEQSLAETKARAKAKQEELERKLTESTALMSHFKRSASKDLSRSPSVDLNRLPSKELFRSPTSTPSSSAEQVSPPSVPIAYYTLEHLQTRPVGIDPGKLEIHLSDDDFKVLYEEEFAKQPPGSVFKPPFPHSPPSLVGCLQHR